MVKVKNVIIIGAGPAGLAAGYELAKAGVKVKILEKNSQVGGLSRTVNFKGYRFDVGPHRFFTKNDEVKKLWSDLLGKDFIDVNRLTRIFYKNKFFFYPLKPFNALFNLGFLDTSLAVSSYGWARIFSRNRETITFEDWVTQKFGKKLFDTFFKTYTEKVWGIPCDQIGAEWAGQRIKGLSLLEAMKKAFLGSRGSKAKSLVEKFQYPVNGAGMMYEKMAQVIKENGGEILLNHEVTALSREKKSLTGVVAKNAGKDKTFTADAYLISAPVTEMVSHLNPEAPTEVKTAADKLYYRDHLTVNLVINQPQIFPDNWIYVHSKNVQMARLSDYKNFSQKMVIDSKKCAVSVEYFCFKDDDIWKKSDNDLIELAKKELEVMDLVKPQLVEDGFVIRETEAYPTYYLGFAPHFNKVKEFIDSFDNLQMIGRAGMYKYNNQDHSIYTGLLAARNLLGKNYDLWAVNNDAEYLEEDKKNSKVKTPITT
jgi:protoporphyrinogen oxidase